MTNNEASLYLLNISAEAESKEYRQEQLFAADLEGLCPQAAERLAHLRTNAPL
jgi:hypothetical protein